MSTSFAISTSSPSMFQGRVAPSEWMKGVVFESPSSSLSSSEQPVSEQGQILTADTACVSTKEKLNCTQTISQKCVCVCVKAELMRTGRAIKILVKRLVSVKKSGVLPVYCSLLWGSNRGQQRPADCPSTCLSVCWPFLQDCAFLK